MKKIATKKIKKSLPLLFITNSNINLLLPPKNEF